MGELIDFTKKRESTTVTYSELGENAEKEVFSREKWGVAEYRGEFIRFYVDPTLINDVFTSKIVENFKERGLTPESEVKIVDFGGGDGVLLNVITKQLAEAGFEKELGVNVDFTSQHLKVMAEKYMPDNGAQDKRKIYGVQGSLTEMPLQAERADAGYSRFVLQYLSKEKQPEAIKQMLAVLKPGAELIVQWPVASETEDQAALADEFDAKVDSIITGIPLDEVKGKRHLISLEEVRKIAAKLGVSCETGFVNDYKMFMSAEAYADRFQIKDEVKLRELKDLFSDPYFREKAKGVDGFTFMEEEGKTYLAYNSGVAVFKK